MEPKLETSNNLSDPQRIHGGKHYLNLEWQTWQRKSTLFKSGMANNMKEKPSETQTTFR